MLAQDRACNKCFHKMHTWIAKSGANTGKRCSKCPNADGLAVFIIFKDRKDSDLWNALPRFDSARVEEIIFTDAPVEEEEGKN